MISIEINKLKTFVSYSNKKIKISRVSIQKLQEEKDKLEKELAKAKEKAIKEYK